MHRDRHEPVVRALPSSNERGLTLTELTIVGVLATIVMLALTVFYFNSQQTWMAGSTQALAQRDATLLVDVMRRRIHEAQDYAVNPTNDHLSLTYAVGVTPSSVEFGWDAAGDRKVHLIVDGVPQGIVIDTPLSKFVVTGLGPTTVELTTAELRTADGDSVAISSKFALLGG
jgi:hypothetical protein